VKKKIKTFPPPIIEPQIQHHRGSSLDSMLTYPGSRKEMLGTKNGKRNFVFKTLEKWQYVYLEKEVHIFSNIWSWYVLYKY
jgi:hypothetical protein